MSRLLVLGDSADAKTCEVVRALRLTRELAVFHLLDTKRRGSRFEVVPEDHPNERFATAGNEADREFHSLI